VATGLTRSGLWVIGRLDDHAQVVGVDDHLFLAYVGQGGVSLSRQALEKGFAGEKGAPLEVGSMYVRRSAMYVGFQRSREPECHLSQVLSMPPEAQRWQQRDGSVPLKSVPTACVPLVVMAVPYGWLSIPVSAQDSAASKNKRKPA
jgi:hypothetical protein